MIKQSNYSKESIIADALLTPAGKKALEEAMFFSFKTLMGWCEHLKLFVINNIDGSGNIKCKGHNHKEIIGNKQAIHKTKHTQVMNKYKKILKKEANL